MSNERLTVSDYNLENTEAYEPPSIIGAAISRVGVFPYYVDGKRKDIFRPRDEVFKTESIKSTYPLPIFVGHPNSEAEKKTIGVTSQEAKIQDDLLVTDIAFIKPTSIGGMSSLSPGYTCFIDWSSGTTPEGQPYDGIQREILYDHIAVVDKGRQGDQVKLFVDSLEAEVSNLFGIIFSPEPERDLVKEQVKLVESFLDIAAEAYSYGYPLAVEDFFNEGIYTPEKAVKKIISSKFPQMILDSTSSCASLISLSKSLSSAILKEKKTNNKPASASQVPHQQNLEILLLNHREGQ
jgi:hypothetical protein